MKAALMAGCLFAAVAEAQPSAAPAPFDPPTWADRRQTFVKKLFGPQAILEPVPGLAFDTARGIPREWGRVAVGAGEGFEMGVSAQRKQDARYSRMPDCGFGERLGNPSAGTVIVRGVNGGPTVGLARLTDVHGAWAIATTWNPPDHRNPLLIVNSLCRRSALGSRWVWPLASQCLTTTQAPQSRR
ncbi:MAG: hypothetical protein JNL98_31265 [Bryobacterales bacterium]|nr:hypothetical protein [Bryobacterales bacterium]